MAIPWWDDRAIDAIRRIESGGNDYTRTGSNYGPFQYSPDLWRQYGGGGDIFNRADATAAYRRSSADDAAAYRKAFGQDPTGGQNYVLHQQGRAGGTALYSNPDTAAWQAIARYYRNPRTAQRAISGNIPSDVRSQYNPLTMTARDFTNLWENKFNRFAGAPLGVPTAPAQVPSPPEILTAARTQYPGRIGSLGAGGGTAPLAGGLGWLSNLFGGRQEAADPVQPLLPDENIRGIGGDIAREPPPLPVPLFGGMGDEAPLTAPPDFPAEATDVSRPSLGNFPAEATDIAGPPPTGLHDPSAFPPQPPQPFQSIGMAPTVPQPFPLTAPVPPDDKMMPSVVVPPEAPATDTGSVPTPAPATPPAGMAPPQVVDRSLAARMLGPDFAGRIRGIINNEAVRSGLGILTNHPELAGNLANAQRTEIMQQDAARRRVLEGREDVTYYGKLAAFNKIFADPDNAPALKGLTPEARDVVKSMGPEGAINWLQQYQLKDAEGRAQQERELELLQSMRTRLRGGDQAAAPGTPPALTPTGPPVPPDVGGLGQPSIGAPAGSLPPQAGPLLSRMAAPRPAPAAAPAPGGGGGGAPAIAGAGPAMPPAPIAGRGAPPSQAAEPIVNTFLGPMPLSQAEELAQQLAVLKRPNPELLAAIAAARAPQQKYLTDIAEGQAKQELGKPAQRGQISTTLDSIAMTKALADKVKSDENLSRVLGPPLWRMTPNVYESTRNVQANIDTLLKRQALDTMARLKQQSATGATGFGSTNDKELGIITGALTNLEDQNQSPGQYKQNIDTLVTALTNAERRIREGWKETYQEEYAEPGGKAPDAYPTTLAETQVQRGRAARAARGLKADADLPRIKGEADYAAIPPDTDFIDPFGKKRHKPRE